MEQKVAISIGDVNLLIDHEMNYIAISNSKVRKAMIFTPQNFNEAFTKLLIDNGADYPQQKEG